MIPAAALVIGVVLGLVLHPTVPAELQPYLPIAVVAAPDGALWLATGEGNTGATSYVGSGVYRLTRPGRSVFSTSNRVGGSELESTFVHRLKFDDAGNVYAASALYVRTQLIGTYAFRYP